MALQRRTAPAFILRMILAGGLAVTGLLAGCGGGSGDAGSATVTPPTTPPVTATSTVTGTAATGAPIAGAVVTLKDSANKSATATTSSTGAFSLDTSGLTPPFLLQVTTPGGTRLLSVSTSANPTATLNITQLTDLVVRSWYDVQGQSGDTAFTNPATLPPPSPQQVQSIAQFLLGLLQLAITANGAPITDPLDLIAKPFTANGSGIDKLLDNTHVTLAATTAQVVLGAGGATQTTTLTFAASTSTMSASSSTTAGSVTTTSTASNVVPVQSAQVQALDAINASLAGLAAAVNNRGAALVAADLEPFFAADLLNEGLNRSQFLAGLVPEMRQLQNVSLKVDQLRALDATAGTAQAIVRFTATQGGSSSTQRETFFFHRGSDGTWRFAGDGRIGEVGVQAEGRRNQGLFTDSNGPSVNIDVRPVVGTVPASASSLGISAPFATGPVQLGSIEVLDSGVQLQPFFSNTGALAGTLPAAGTPVALTLQLSAGGTVTYTVPLNAFTTELIQVTQPTGTTITTGTHTVNWTLPTTYAVERIQLSVLAFTTTSGSSTGFQCIADSPVVAPTATSGQITIAATCNGQPVRQVNINVSTNGFNGERSIVVYGLNITP